LSSADHFAPYAVINVLKVCAIDTFHGGDEEEFSVIGSRGVRHKKRSAGEFYREHAKQAAAAICGFLFLRTPPGKVAMDWFHHQPRVVQVGVMALFIALFVGGLSLFDLVRRRYSGRAR